MAKMQPIKASDAMSNITMEVEVHLTGLKWLRFRIWMSVNILKIAAWVGGYEIEIKDRELEDESL